MARNTAIHKLKEYIQDEDICNRIETSIYEYTMITAKKRRLNQDLGDQLCRRIYVNKLHQIYTNLNPNSYVKNLYFLERIINQEINPSTVAFLTPQELNYEHWEEMMNKQSAGDEFLNSSNNMGTQTDEYTCARCKKNDCHYYTAQLRSCDEPASLIVFCNNCNKKWRIG